MSKPKRRAVIITALPSERDAVVEHLHDIKEETVRGSVYRIGTFDEKSDPWEIVVAEIGPGNETAAAEAERLLGHFKPDIAIFVGIAGGFKDLSRGDVVAATKVYNYESGKDAPTEFQPRPDTVLPAHALLSRARHEAGERGWIERIRPTQPGQTPPPSIRATVGPIAAGPKVLASTRSTTFSFLQQNYGDTLAVEMEGFGFLRSVHMNHPIQGIVVRGISDCIGDKTPGNDMDWQPIAARHAAAFAFQILAKLEDNQPSGRSVTVEAARDVQSLESYWQALKGIAEHPLLETVFTASREAEISVIAKWLSEPPSALWMRANGLTDALDFIAALGSRREFAQLQRGVIVHSLGAWRQFTAMKEPQILIASPALEIHATDAAAAVQVGHHVFVSGPRVNLADKGMESLRRQDYYEISKALTECGFSDGRATSLARACCGSSSILKRLITAHPDTVFPPWSHRGMREQLAPFSLLGGWKNVDPPSAGSVRPIVGSPPPLDVWAVTELIGCDRDQLDQYVTEWQAGPEPLFIQFGSTVFVASREDAWHLLNAAITPGQIKRFQDLAELILEEDNPAFELAADQRWMASVYGKTHQMSEDLRRSVVETLALMGTYSSATNLASTVRSILERVLPVGAPWQRWASMGHNLSVLCEADPEFFLSRVESDLRSSDPELPKLFQDKGHGFFGGGAIHSDLLWALEGLAWAPEYLKRVSICFAKLAARDPGGTYANRPANSLHHTFLWWHWQTNATIEERIDAISAVMAAEPLVGWNLLKSLLPSQSSTIATNNHMPRWRPWADGWSRTKLRSMTGKYAAAIARLAINVAGTDPQRWSAILEGMLRFSPQITDEVLGVLDRICDEKSSLSHDSIFVLWKELRNLVARHERYSDATWAFDETVRARLSSIRDRMEPTDAVSVYSWLFESHAELPGFNRARDYLAHDKALQNARQDAIKKIVETEGAAGVKRLLGLNVDARLVGWIVGHQRLINPGEMDIPAAFGSTGYRMAAATGYVSGRFVADNWSFIDEFPLADWTATQVAAVGLCLPFEVKTWRWLADRGEDVARDYWKRIRGFLHDPTFEAIRFATASYISVGRGESAIELLQTSTAIEGRKVPIEFIAETLENALMALGAGDSAVGGGLGYPVQQLVKVLQSDTSFDRTRLARIEWGYLPLLDPDFSEIGPATLVDVIASEPSFYVDLLKLVFRGEGETETDAVLTDQEQQMASHASRLLEKLTRLPGTNDKGDIDFEYLETWVKQVQAKAAEFGRRKICDLTLGQFFGRASKIAAGKPVMAGYAALTEKVGTDEFFRGFVNGVLNSRGLVSRDPRAGGELERELVGRYRQMASDVRANAPRLADAMLELVRHYEWDARLEDDEAQRHRTGKF